MPRAGRRNGTHRSCRRASREPGRRARRRARSHQMAARARRPPAPSSTACTGTPYPSGRFWHVERPPAHGSAASRSSRSRHASSEQSSPSAARTWRATSRRTSVSGSSARGAREPSFLGESWMSKKNRTVELSRQLNQGVVLVRVPSHDDALEDGRQPRARAAGARPGRSSRRTPDGGDSRRACRRWRRGGRSPPRRG